MHTTDTSVLTAAHAYASRGWRVIPIRPGTKHPPMPEWQNVATTDVDTITAWFTGPYHRCGVGIVTGAASGLFVVDVDLAAGKRGDDTLTELIATHAHDWPDTVMARTGGGGRHYLFAWPLGEPIRNSAGSRLGEGLDVRGEGGQIVAPPSLHPSGVAYGWEPDAGPDDVAVSPAPDWLLDILTGVSAGADARQPHLAGRKEPAAPADRDDDSPAAWFNERTSWEELLVPDGWTAGTVRGAETRWTRPGKVRREGISATTGHDGRDVLKVFTSSVVDLEAERAYSRFGYLAATRYGGDRSACARALRAEMGGPSPLGPLELPWEATEPSEVIDGAAGPPEPATLALGPRGGIMVAALARRVRDDLAIEAGEDGRLWRYHSGVYRPDGQAWAKARTCELLGDRYGAKHVEEVLSWLRAAFLPTIGIEPDARWINCTNGMLDWSTGELLVHDPAFRSVWQVPVPWRETEVNGGEAVLDFLELVVPPDAVGFVLEVIGYALFSGNPFRKAVLLLGPGRNGKSTFLALVRALLGSENCAAVPLQTLAENRFAGSTLFGKTANIAGDLDARAVKRTDLFKMLTGGDPIFTERKYGDAFHFICWALPVFAANEVPSSPDHSAAWHDRWLIIPFDRRFTEEEADPKLLAKLTTPEELEALFLLAVRGLQNLMTRGRFEVPASVEAAGMDYRARNDPILAFLLERCVFDLEVWLPRADLYRAYRDWCGQERRVVEGATSFVRGVRRVGPDLPLVPTERIRNGVRGWAGLGWST